MAESFLSFGNSELFRKQLLVRNLQPYGVPGAYTSPGNPVNYETNLTVSNVVDSPNNYVSTNLFASDLYPLNEYGPEGGFGNPIGVNLTPVLEPNQGPYYPVNGAQTQGLVLVNEFFIESAYVTNKWGPSGGYKDLVIITDVQQSGLIYQPYWYPAYYSYSSYSTYGIVFSDDPLGSNGPLSADSFLAKIGAEQLKFAFNERIAQELEQATIGAINLDTITDPFSASLLATGQQPFFIRNWKITVPENPALAAVSLANRLTGTYFPVSFIPGDYFDDDNPINGPQNAAALGVANNLTGGLLAPILNKYRSPSEVFVANTGNGQRSALFSALDYNLYRPAYNRGIVGGLIAGASAAVNRLFDQDKAQSSGYYVGSENAEPAQIDGPPNQLPVNQFGVQQQTIVYGPQELGILYEGNENQLNFGLKGKSYTDGGGTSGQMVWTSPKYKGDAGFRATVGGGAGSLDDEFNQISGDYLRYQSIDVPFRPGSILYETQRLVDSADQVQGQARLKHVGTAINQVSKVFNDGYKELTKGSRVLSYVNQADGTQAGLEYCRVFQKDTPYYTYADLQKVDGITTSGRRFDYSIFDNTYNLNIAPLRNPGSTNIVDGKVKKYMFSIENLAWRTSDRPGYTYDDLPVCEKGPNGGRIMWFPPYNVKFNDDTKPDFNATSFIGRPEPIYTYKNTSRSGQISWTIIVDNPSMMNTIIEKQLKGASKDRIQSIIDSFFAGCTKYDMYELGIKFNTIPTKDLYTYQQILNNPRLTTEEQVEVLQSIPVNQEATNDGDASGADGTQGTTGTGNQQKENIQYVDSDLSNYVGYGLYFENDVPGGPNGTKPGENKQGGTSAYNYDYYYNQYIGLEPTYLQQAPQNVYVGTDQFTKEGIPNFFSTVITGNFNVIQNDLIQKQLNEILVDKKGKVEIEFVGSASAPQTISYNKKLSERRNDSVKKWFLAQKLKDGKTLEQYQSEGWFKITLNPNGEQLVIPKTKEEAAATSGDTTDISVTNAQGGNVLNAGVDCTKNITLGPTENPTSGDVQQSSKAQWYSIPAMACRRVAIQRIKAEIPKTETPEPSKVPPKPVPTPVPNILTGQTQSIKPDPKITIEQKIKEGISKKILRNLFTECDYFQIIKESDPMVYDSIKDKIKYFSPAFHSMTPEGLNARLTFLQQCMRPGQTIPVIGADGRPKYNDALNTTFGAPPILILRFGDFYHTKIVPTNLGISYDPLHLDINPEGIGVQPMLANISLSFNIIGGMGLKEPVQELQNALSFNYYANTEIYDERATATEDTSKMDQYVVQKITSALPTVSSQEAANIVNNVQPKKGGSTIGVIASETEMDYTTILTSLQDGLQGYFKAYYDAISKINTDYNFGALQIALQEKSYTEGDLSEYTNDKVKTTLYGKSNNYQEYVENLIKEVKKDIEQNDDPILSTLKGVSQMTNKIKRELEDKLQAYATQRQQPMLDVIVNNTSNITKVTTDLNFIFRQLDVVSDKLDGDLGSNNEPNAYDLSGDTFFGPATTDGTLANLFTKKVPETITKFEKLLESYKIISKDGFFNPRKSTIENGSGCKFVVNNKAYFGSNGDCPWNRFYIAMSPLFTKEQSFTEFVNDLVSGPEIKNNQTIIDLVKKACNNVKDDYIPFQKEWTDTFTNIEKSQDYVTVTTFKLPDAQIKKCNFKTPATDNVNQKNKKLKDLYSSVNLNDNKKTFNGKVTFN
jgi:outer membrane protein OmpA-like peptidoglycan-associated protein